jgi:hypothetical protein
MEVALAILSFKETSQSFFLKKSALVKGKNLKSAIIMLKRNHILFMCANRATVFFSNPTFIALYIAIPIRI